MVEVQNSYVEQLKSLVETLSKVNEQSSRLTRDSEELIICPGRELRYNVNQSVELAEKDCLITSHLEGKSKRPDGSSGLFRWRWI